MSEVNELRLICEYKVSSFISLASLVVFPILLGVLSLLRTPGLKFEYHDITSKFIVMIFCIAIIICLSGRLVFTLFKKQISGKSKLWRYRVANIKTSVFVLIVTGICMKLISIWYGWISISILLICPIYFMIFVPNFKLWRADLGITSISSSDSDEGK